MTLGDTTMVYSNGEWSREADELENEIVIGNNQDASGRKEQVA
jgi:hypothetical protein